jgi:hypothetical protein
LISGAYPDHLRFCIKGSHSSKDLFALQQLLFSSLRRSPMKKLCMALAIGAVAGLFLGLPVFSAGPTVTKRVAVADDASSVVVVRVTASGSSIYSIAITDESGSVEDIVSPKGWSGVASEGHIVFATVDHPIASGSSKSFRIVTTNADAGLSVRLHDANRLLTAKKDI